MGFAIFVYVPQAFLYAGWALDFLMVLSGLWLEKA